MDAETTKRRGPITLFGSSRRLRWAAAIAVVVLPLLYVLSSGPMILWTWHSRMVYGPVGPGGGPAVAEREIDIPDWWLEVYGPLEWASEQSWGNRLIWWYWNSWIPDTPPPPPRTDGRIEP